MGKTKNFVYSSLFVISITFYGAFVGSHESYQVMKEVYKLKPEFTEEGKPYPVKELAEVEGPSPNKNGAVKGGIIGSSSSVFGLCVYSTLKRKRRRS